jgi:hypothetical protein
MLHSFAEWLQDTAFAQWVAIAGFPWIESCHVLCITAVVGTITIVDLRLLNLTSKRSSVTRLSNDLLPFTWCAFALAALTGSILFISKPTAYVADVPFQMMMLTIALAGLNMLVFHFTVYRRVVDWDGQPDTPTAAKIAAALSLLFWATVIVCGRWIGFTVR